MELQFAPGAAPASEVAFEVFGVSGVVAVSPRNLLGRVQEILPPGSKPPASVDVHAARFLLVASDGSYMVKAGEATDQTSDLEVALGILDAGIRAHIAFSAPEYIFVHAAVVEVDGRAIVIPGRSFSGKTTLAAALLSLGTSYYSDEFAVLDQTGLVHPYPKPLSIRVPGTTQASDHPWEKLATSVGDSPIPIGLIAITQYAPHAIWKPESRTAGEGALALLANTVPVRARPNEALEAIAKATARATVVEGKRGEATAAASAILAVARGDAHPEAAVPVT